MKGTVLRPKWPAPARTDANGKPAAKSETMSDITLALLEEHAFDSTTTGYDPYNTNAGRRMSEVWKRKPKRE